MDVIMHGLSYREAEAYGLALTSAGIAWDSKRVGRGWVIMVDGRDADEARELIERYREENRDAPAADVPAEKGVRTWTGLWAALVLMAFHLATSGEHRAFLDAGAARALDILSGRVWLALTALTLHADAAHLASNMAGMAIFGTLVCSFTGYGLGWLLILLSGGLGNVLNALLHQSFHSSVGASTAVFGAVGILGGYRFAQALQHTGRASRALVPVAAAMALLALLGEDQRTDVTGHLFGWIAGSLLGLLYGLSVRRPERALAVAVSDRLQLFCLLLTLGLLAWAWRAALAN